ncbi:MAG: hypothetical protein HXY34_02560 [Candidatus Thorarchaeota archaeon]|nr:hypothetical protein [Candidatus Thorarchaeota archaeon]
MRDLTVSNELRVLTEDCQLISAKTAIVESRAGCIWAPLMRSDTRVGVVFMGPSRIAVDAITETEMGAIGRSITDSLTGVSVLIGAVSVEQKSRDAQEDDFPAAGCKGVGEFLQMAQERLRELRLEKSDMDSGSMALFAKGSDEEDILLRVKDDSIVFMHGRRIHVLSKQSSVSVGEEGVAVRGRRGKTIVIGRHDLWGLDGLSDLPDMIERQVRRAIRVLDTGSSPPHRLHGRFCHDVDDGALDEADDWDS